MRAALMDRFGLMILLSRASLFSKVSAQTENVALNPQNNTFSSSYQLTQNQIAAAGISSTLANNVEVALSFERSNWANGSVHQEPFYQVPSNASHAPAGALLKVQIDANASAYTLPPDTALSRIMFQTETLNGTLVPASAYVLWLYLPRQVTDGYSVVTWAHGTSGIFAECGPSHVRNLWYHFQVPYSLALQGYVVVAPDFQGLGVDRDVNGDKIIHPYASNPSHANDLIYAVQAAQTAFNSLSKRFVVVGHSQGGGAAWGAAERQSSRPVEGYLGTVTGSPLTNFITTVDLEGSIPWSGCVPVLRLLRVDPG